MAQAPTPEMRPAYGSGAAGGGTVIPWALPRIHVRPLRSTVGLKGVGSTLRMCRSTHSNWSRAAMWSLPMSARIPQHPPFLPSDSTTLL